MSDDANEALLKKSSKKAKDKGLAVSEPDLIASTATELENLSREDAYAMVPELNNSVDHSYFRLGGVLAVLQAKESWWKDDGYDNFRQFIEAKFGLQYRKAMYLIGIYGALVESGVEWHLLMGIGWSKAKEIAPILTIDNVDEWVAKAQEMTVLQLHEAVKKAQEGTLTKSDEEPTETGISTFTCKVHPDQKETIKQAVEKAKKEAGTEFPGVALEAICMNYLSGAKVAKPKSLTETFAGHSYEEVLKAFTEVWPDIDLTVSI